MLPSERKVFKRFLTIYEDSSNSIKSSKLLELLLNNGNNSDESFFIKELYDSVNTSNAEAFRKMLERFRDKIYECSILDVNINRKDRYPKAIAATLDARKMLSSILATLIKGIPLTERKRLIGLGLKLCREYELYDELIILLKHQYDDVDSATGYSKNKFRIDEILNAIEYSKAIYRSKVLFYFYIHDIQFSALDPLELTEEIEKAVQELDEIYGNYKSDNILYNKLMLSAQLCHFKLNYAEAENVLNQLVNTILNSKALFTRNRVTLAMMNLSYTQCFLYKFDDALTSMVKSREYYAIQKSEFQNLYRESEVFLLIYLKRYKEAEEMLNIIIENGGYEDIPVIVSRRKYLESIVSFLNYQFKNSFKLLQETREIEGDKEGWNIGIRLLLIFLTLETEKIDLADQKIENLRKHIERTTKMKSIRKRDVVIFRLLNNLARSGFDFTEVWEDKAKDFALLRSDDPDYRWVPRSHELILFDQWFESKVKKVPYNPVFPEPIREVSN